MLSQALKFCCMALNMERKTGLEPATLGLEGQYSSQLSYFRKLWGHLIA